MQHVRKRAVLSEVLSCVPPAGAYRHLAIRCWSLPQAIEQLGNLPVHIPIPLGPCAILFGIIALVVSDSVLSSFLAPESYKQQLQAEHNTNIAQRKTGFFTCGHLNVEPAVAAEAVAAMQKLRHAISAVTMELGCIFHSVIIGIGVGVINNDRHLVLTLITALAIHQGLEGLALGSVLALTNFSMLKKVFMLFLYSITTPVGEKAERTAFVVMTAPERSIKHASLEMAESAALCSTKSMQLVCAAYIGALSTCHTSPCQQHAHR